LMVLGVSDALAALLLAVNIRYSLLPASRRHPSRSSS
jgi:divalent metal cation (Fe/Co/Zn/Cd) transporter